MYISYTIVLTAILELAHALPSNSTRVPKTFSIQQLDIGKEISNATLLARDGSGLEGSANLPIPPEGLMFLVPAIVAGTAMHLVLDTGSTDSWCYSDLMSESSRSGHPHLKTADATLLKQAAPWKQVYIDGLDVQGRIYKGSLSIGGVTVSNQAIIAATEVRSEPSKIRYMDGILGLAFISTTKPRQNTFFENIRSELASPIFTITLRKGALGTIDFGFINKNTYTGDITYINVKDMMTGHWNIESSKFAIGTEPEQHSSITGVVDSGSAWLLLPPQLVEAYYSNIENVIRSPNKGRYVVPCNTKLPDLTMTFGGKRFTIPGRFLYHQEMAMGYCFSKLQSTTDNGKPIFGIPFLQSVFAVFEPYGPSGPRIGLAQQANRR